MRVRAASVNPLEMPLHARRAVRHAARTAGCAGRGTSGSASTSPAPSRPSAPTSTTFKPGDEVFGGRNGALAEYIVVADAVGGRQAGERQLRAGRGRAGRRGDGAAGRARHGHASSRRPARADQRRVGRRRHLRGADRQGARRRRSPASAAPATSSWCARSAPTTRSTTPARTTRRAPQRYDVIVDMVGNHSLLANRRALTAEGHLRDGRRAERPLDRAARSRHPHGRAVDRS